MDIVPHPAEPCPESLEVTSPLISRPPYLSPLISRPPYVSPLLSPFAGLKRSILGAWKHEHEMLGVSSSNNYTPLQFTRGSSEYSDQSYEYPIGEASPNSSPMQYRARSLTPPPDRRDYIPQPQPLSYTELNRLPVVKLQDNERHIKCCCDKPWEKDEEVTQLMCGHKLHSTCACKLMDTGVCPICKSADVIEDKLREIRIDLSGFNF